MNLVDQIFRDVFTPKPQESAADWLRMYFYDHTGRAFDETSVPWITAPQGPCWAYDSIQFRTIWLQWAARMFKTNFSLGMLMRSMDQRPEETMFATPDETNCKSVFGRFWKMLENCPRLKDQVPIAQRQNKSRITLRRSVCHGAWPRGKSRLADKSIRVGAGNEIDKWEHQTTSTEGDPLERFRKRGAEFPDRKFVLESTPSVKGKSNVESGRISSTNHRYYVPCPHCHKFQTIEYGDGSSPGGIFYDKLPNGQSDRDLARRTAHYVCRHCEGRIDDIHRPWMMTRGVWVPAGCGIDHEKAMDARNLPPDDTSWLTGTPLNWGSDYGSQISVFYALFHGWGAIAYDFISKHKSPSKLRQWINEDKGETWEPRKSKSTPEMIGERLAGKTPRGIVPENTRFLTVTIDQQEGDREAGTRHVKYVVLAHSSDESATLIDYGIGKSLKEIWEPVVRRAYTRSDNMPPMIPVLSAADSGWDTKATYDFCNARQQIIACKGEGEMAGRPYRLGTVERGEYEGQLLFGVNTDYWETELQARMDERLPGDEGSLILCVDAARDIALLEELCNAVLSDKTDQRGNAKLFWERKNDGEPNDFRDAVRYGLALAQLIRESGGSISDAPHSINHVNRVADEETERRAGFVRTPAESSGGWIRRRSQ